MAHPYDRMLPTEKNSQGAGSDGSNGDSSMLNHVAHLMQDFKTWVAIQEAGKKQPADLPSLTIEDKSAPNEKSGKKAQEPKDKNDNAIFADDYLDKP